MLSMRSRLPSRLPYGTTLKAPATSVVAVTAEPGSKISNMLPTISLYSRDYCGQLCKNRHDVVLCTVTEVGENNVRFTS
ncbi:unnamed protein product [Protopolystoma xenopodis]|uniref:Uncharacterized protein n=1 Tax=Protopolystoma xenopodis TaxID=117903 RepID=A0A3S5BLA9_9PLAT|nr:unnamed protein product [Protopolystoma xenopodis]